MTRQRFWTWLEDQATRDDPVGDLARDAKRSPPPSKTAQGLANHLDALGAGYWAKDALKRAKAEWKAKGLLPPSRA